MRKDEGRILLICYAFVISYLFICLLIALVVGIVDILKFAL